MENYMKSAENLVEIWRKSWINYGKTRFFCWKIEKFLENLGKNIKNFWEKSEKIMEKFGKTHEIFLKKT